jgi:hypothetical protein
LKEKLGKLNYQAPPSSLTNFLYNNSNKKFILENSIKTSKETSHEIISVDL